MSYFEGSGECHPLEFDYFRSERLSAAELRLEVVYTLMLAYNYTPTHRQATRLATRITAMAVAHEGGIDIRFHTLDEDFNPVDEYEAQIDASGEWRTAYANEGGETVTIDGYFKGYDEGIGAADPALAEHQELASV